jgi:cytochrome c oxidase subunit 2
MLTQLMLTAPALLGAFQESAGGPVTTPGTHFFPPRASSVAWETDRVYLLIFWLCLVAFVIIVAGTAYFVWKYRAREGHKAVKTPTHDNVLEVTWTVIPTILFGVMFWVGMDGLLDLRQAPGDALPVQVTAQKWAWTFTYPNGAQSPELHVPIDRPVKLTMTSTDVLHSLFIPAFRVKQDVVPGRYTSLWFDANDDVIPAGEATKLYDLFCTEYCGEKHSAMITKVVVHTGEGFLAWAEETANFIKNEPAWIAGQKQFVISGCNACHAITDQNGTGPGLLTLSQLIKDGGEVDVIEGGVTKKVPATLDYLRQSILQANTQVKVGYTPQMPLFQGQLNEQQVDILRIYIQGLADVSLQGNTQTLAQMRGETVPADGSANGAADGATPPTDGGQ